MNNSEFESLSSLINSSVVSLHGILVGKSGSSLSYEKIKDSEDFNWNLRIEGKIL